ncbi:hypothetical protein MLD38_003051 [Melastoma candidum]|uniref:Uncharacterized protein n=1 Tax=Melastoma candidum TaxID=119954 RepID=A0ACB9S1D3_9MYRT|nr:hypothetical protein MLD38_003051 [Melastoma candidum]
MIRFNLKRGIRRHVSTLRRLACHLWFRFVVCSGGKSRSTYRMLLPSPPSKRGNVGGRKGERGSEGHVAKARTTFDGGADSDLVALKISLLGDHQIGKTSFLAKYVGDGKEQNGAKMEEGLILMDKTILVRGARISYSIWEVEGEDGSEQHVPMACKDSVAILFMFDLTSRCTLNSVISWYQKARRWNQSAILIIVGTKFDDFVKLPIDLQWTIASQARAYARALNATLFFSSTAYNINVNKIFKFITARLFDLPWTVERNLTVGEPIIDF